METKHIVLVVIGVIVILALVYRANCKKCSGLSTEVLTEVDEETETETETTPETNTGTTTA